MWGYIQVCYSPLLRGKTGGGKGKGMARCLCRKYIVYLAIVSFSESNKPCVSKIVNACPVSEAEYQVTFFVPSPFSYCILLGSIRLQDGSEWPTFGRHPVLSRPFKLRMRELLLVPLAPITASMGPEGLETVSAGTHSAT